MRFKNKEMSLAVKQKSSYLGKSCPNFGANLLPVPGNGTTPLRSSPSSISNVTAGKIGFHFFGGSAGPDIGPLGGGGRRLGKSSRCPQFGRAGCLG